MQALHCRDAGAEGRMTRFGIPIYRAAPGGLKGVYIDMVHQLEHSARRRELLEGTIGVPD